MKISGNGDGVNRQIESLHQGRERTGLTKLMQKAYNNIDDPLWMT